MALNQSELLENLKMYLGDEIESDDDSKDVFLSFLLDLALNKILEKLYPFDNSKSTIPNRYQFKQIEIALYLYNKIGADWQTSHSENGISRSYENADIPDSLMQGITPFVGVF